MKIWTEWSPYLNNQRTKSKLFWKLVIDNFLNSTSDLVNESELTSNLVVGCAGQKSRMDGNP